MDKTLVTSNQTQIQPKPIVEHTTPPPSVAYVESVHMTGDRLINAVLKNCYPHGGLEGDRSE